LPACSPPVTNVNIPQTYHAPPTRKGNRQDARIAKKKTKEDFTSIEGLPPSVPLAVLPRFYPVLSIVTSWPAFSERG
jgi:hypothetical protein